MSKTQLVFGLLFVVLVTSQAAIGKNRNTPKSLFAKYKDAVVKVVTPTGGFGTGFFVAPDLIITANHVVMLPNGTYAPVVQLIGSAGPIGLAKPTTIAPTPQSLLQDFVLLRMVGPLPKVNPLMLGSWTDVVEGDDVVTIGYPLGPASPWLISGMVAACVSGTPNVIVFQGAANKGLSGAPLMSIESGKVVGVVTTKFVSAGPVLDQARRRLRDPQGATIVLGTVSVAETMAQVVDALDNFLISGMGGAVAIDYSRDAAFPSTPKQ